MRIAQIAPLYTKVEASPRYATAAIVYLLTEGLVRQGHDVTLFATGNSQTSARLVAVTDSVVTEETLSKEAVHHGSKAHLYSYLSASKAYQRAEEFDIIHLHLGNDGHVEGLFFSPLVKSATVASVQAMFRELMPEVVEEFSQSATYVALSNNHLGHAPNNLKTAVIHNGIPIENFEYSARADEYLLFCSRLHPDKGVVEAINAAEQTSKSLIIAGHPSATKPEYFQTIQEAMKRSNTDTQLIPDVSEADKALLYGRAKAMLFPIKIEEPFGLVLVESMACGTPVIAFARGATTEIMVDGVTGFLVNPNDDDIRGNFLIKKTGMDGMKEAIKRLYDLPEAEYKAMRQASRRRVEEHFTAERMVQNYVELYQKLIDNKNQ